MQFALVLVMLILALVGTSDAFRSLRALSDASTTTSAPLNTLGAVGYPLLPPLAVAEKEELCKRDFQGFNRTLRLMKVSPKRRPATPVEDDPAEPPSRQSKAKYPRIFCYVCTISSHHKTHAQLIADTWGQRCDKLVFFSNVTGTLVVNENTEFQVDFPVLKMDAPADYSHLWLKHREVVKYMYHHYRHDYDWFYKADDDTYVVVDNLRDYLLRPEILMNYKRQPMDLGKRFRLEDNPNDSRMRNKKVAGRWKKAFDRWLFNSGGPGYAMNRLFLDQFVATMEDKTCFSEPWAETTGEDIATTYCMMWHGVEAWDTRDLRGRPRWHAWTPATMYGLDPAIERGWWIYAEESLGGTKWGDDCCAPDSIGYHYIKGEGMYHMERILYYCRDDEAYDIATFNRKYGLAISDKVASSRGHRTGND